MKQTLHPVLSTRNIHHRDQYIQFFEEDHKYVITNDPENKYTSVTTWNHSHFPIFKLSSIFHFSFSAFHFFVYICTR